MRRNSALSTFVGLLNVLADLMNGGRHSRRTVSKAYRCSLPTADRWLGELERHVPGVKSRRVGNVTWLEWVPPKWARGMT